MVGLHLFTYLTWVLWGLIRKWACWYWRVQFAPLCAHRVSSASEGIQCLARGKEAAPFPRSSTLEELQEVTSEKYCQRISWLSSTASFLPDPSYSELSWLVLEPSVWRGLQLIQSPELGRFSVTWAYTLNSANSESNPSFIKHLEHEKCYM